MIQGRGFGKSAEVLRQSLEAAQAGKVVLVANVDKDLEVVMLPAKRYRELLAAAGRTSPSGGDAP